MQNVIVPDHPLLRHKLTLLRDRYTPTSLFRQVAREVSLLMAYEVTRDLPLRPIDIETPMEPTRAEHLDGKKLCIVSILRAGNGILEGMLDLMPSARVGHIGLFRDAETLRPVEDYVKLPSDIAERRGILVDPMLATGNSAIAAVARLKQEGVTNLKFVCLIAAPEGIAAFTTAHSDVPIFAGAIDRELDSHGYIHPGLGDAGDRFYGTR